MIVADRQGGGIDVVEPGLGPYHPSVFHASHRGGKGRQA
jgi:hypothetical protein